MQNWEYILGISSILLLAVPVTLLLVERKEGGSAFLALALYFLQIILGNLISTGIIRTSENTELYIGIANNLLDAPLMLLTLRYFTLVPSFRKTLLYLAAGYLVFELIVFLFTGISRKMLTITIGPGLILVMGLVCYFFFTHVQSSFNRNKDKGKAFMSGGLVFAYACFNFMYVLYYILDNPNYADLLKIYHLTHIVLAITMSIGLLIIMSEKRKKPRDEPKVKQEEINAFQYL